MLPATLNIRLALVALGCAALAACSSDHDGPLAPASPRAIQASDTTSATLRSGYMLSTGWSQPSPQEEQNHGQPQPQQVPPLQQP